jgi:hypothetical protein
MDIVVLNLNQLKLWCAPRFTVHLVQTSLVNLNSFLKGTHIRPCPNTFMHILGRFCTMSKIEGYFH